MLLIYRKGAIMFTITVVVFSLVIGALAHKLYLESKMAKKRRNPIRTVIGKGSKSKRCRHVVGLQSHLNPKG